MKMIQFSIVIFYREDGTILIQDRRNLGKDTIEWGFFGGHAEGNESSIDTAIREIYEEVNVTLLPSDLTHIAEVVTQKTFLGEQRVGYVFSVPWRSAFEQDFQVLEGAGFDWVSPDEMRERVIYDGQRYYLSLFEEYLKKYA